MHRDLPKGSMVSASRAQRARRYLKTKEDKYVKKINLECEVVEQIY